MDAADASVEMEELDQETGRPAQGRVKNNSAHCAALVNDYWRKQGRDPQARTKKGERGLVIVISNMLNGYPTKSL